MNRVASRLTTIRRGGAAEQRLERRDALASWLLSRQTWDAIGPFPEEGGAPGVDTEHPPEVDSWRAARYEVPGGQLAWRRVAAWTGDPVDLRRELAPRDSVVGYAKTTVHASAERAATLSVGCDDGCKVWLNGEVVMEVSRFGGHRVGQFNEPVELREGRNDLVIKVTQRAQDWGFSLDLIDEQRWPLALRWSSDE